jgi:hypothetical protein
MIYQTKKRIWEIKKRKALTLFIGLTIGVAAIAISYQGLITELQIYSIDAVYAKEVKPVVKELTIKEHICAATNGENCDVIYNLCMKESGCRKYAINHNDNGTFDYSYFQINSIHIKSGAISYDCAYDLYCSARWVNEKIKAGQLHIWTAAKKI